MSEWVAYEQIEGPVLGPRRDDLRAGVIAATIHNVNRGKTDKALSPEDFTLEFEKAPDPQERFDSQISLLRRATESKQKAK